VCYCVSLYQDVSGDPIAAQCVSHVILWWNFVDLKLLQSDSIGSECVRNVERGSRIVTAISHDTKVILQVCSKMWHNNNQQYMWQHLWYNIRDTVVCTFVGKRILWREITANSFFDQCGLFQQPNHVASVWCVCVRVRACGVVCVCACACVWCSVCVCTGNVVMPFVDAPW